ncbi:MAG: hypothetical protein JSU87_07280 [Gemmatimonadota bacterium]|nr:MAG: hypothetical protein JSU87_07280 [Gemmatimonadota bacterium]
MRSIEIEAIPQPSEFNWGDDVADQDRIMASWVTEKRSTEQRARLYRVILRAQEYLGTSEEHHAKVVAPDALTAASLTIEALELDPADLAGVGVTLICEDSQQAKGRVFDKSHRSRGFGERGGWLPDCPLAHRR